MTAKKNTTVDLTAHADISVLTAPKEKRLEVGAKVQILQHKHLKCASTGHVQSINGAYIYVRPDDSPVSALNPAEGAFELYPNELRVLATYRHKDFIPGTVVRIKNLDWGHTRPKSHGIVCGVEAQRIIVQPVGARKGALISLPPEDLAVERNDEQLPAQALIAQVAILAVLRALDRSVSLSQLKSLLATQPAAGDIDENLARLSNGGKIILTESQATAVKDEANTASAAADVELQDAIAALAQAEKRLVDAVHQAIVRAS